MPTPPLPPVRAGDHDRFECRSCTSCCRSFTIAVGDAEIARIAAHDWASDAAGLAAEGAGGALPGWLERDATSGLRVLRRRRDGACVFLDDDGLCLVHKRLGAAAKPDLCRLFPLALVRAPDGAIDASVVPECLGWHESYERGAPLASLRDVPADVPERLIAIAPPAIPVRAGGPLLLWADARALARRLGALLGASDSLEAAIPGFGAALDEAEARAGRTVVRRDPRAEPAGSLEETRARSPGETRTGSLEETRLSALAILGRSLREAGSGDAEGALRLRALLDATQSLVPAAGWARAFAALPPDTGRFLAAVLRAWIEGPTLAQTRVEVEATVGLLVLFTRVAAARALAIAGPAVPSPLEMNRAAKEVSLVLRDRALAGLIRAAAPTLRALLRTGLDRSDALPL